VHRTSCNGGHMVWHEWGHGPPLVLMHGGFGSWMHWIRNVEALALHYRVLAADIPGLGASDAVCDNPTPQSIGTVVAQGLRELVGDEPLHLTGFSFGALISGQVCLQLGGQVRTFTLVGASGMDLPRPSMELMRRHDGMAQAERLAALKHNLNTLMLRHPSSIDELAIYVQEWNDAHSRVRSRRMSLGDSLALALPDITARLGGIWGELDATAGEFLDLRADLLRHSQPDVPFTVIPDAGHWVQYEVAEAFNATLLEYLRAS
jgi:2-hydroxy-6-oxonona-2,4-dienedioate hydrolase